MPAPLKVALAVPAARRTARRVLIAVAGTLVLLIAVMAALLGGLATQQAQQTCGPASEAGDRLGAETGALGGISGTGITRGDLRIVRAGRTPSVTPGDYLTTAYGPPWGGIQGPGISTSAGLRINGGAPKKYWVAVDPSLISYGSWVYIWPNPFKWKGAFLAADTGGAITGRRIDFYDWRGRTPQNAWGRTPAKVSSKPILEDDAGATTPTLVNVSDPADPAVDCDGGSSEVGGSGAGRKAAQLAVQQLGKNARVKAFKGFQPPTFSDAWCSWFLSNLWRLAGVKIGTLPFTGDVYQWGAKHPDLLIKKAGQPARTLKLPVGTALLYGSGPGYGASVHVNMVRSVNPDGTVQIIGGNQGSPGRVTSYGPCRLTNGPFVRSSCDPRPIYGIVAPSLDSDDATPTERTKL